jgi:putative transposase
MITGRPKQPIVLQKEERVQLKAMAHSRSLPHGLVMRARLVLMAAEGVPNNRIAEKLDLSPQSVCKWRQRYLEQRLVGLHDELRPGRPRSISDERVATLLRKTLQTKPKDGTHWSIRPMAHQTRPIDNAISNSLPIPSSLKKSAISSGCT